MLVGCEANRKTRPAHHQSLVWFTSDGKKWTQQLELADPDFWPWRGKWHNCKEYFCGYGCRTDNRGLGLYTTTDGKEFETLVSKLNVESAYPNETSVWFFPDGTCYTLLRTEGVHSSQIGISRPHYREWTWKKLGAPVLAGVATFQKAARIGSGVPYHQGNAYFCQAPPDAGRNGIPSRLTA